MPPANRTPVVILSAPSGTGKTSLANALMSRCPQLAFSVSATTREQRPNEVDGEDYLFLGLRAFEDKIHEGAFVEWEEVYPGRMYGTLFSEVARIARQGKAALFDVDVNGGQNLKERFQQDALAIFIAPPSLEALRDRLQRRGTDTPEQIEQRLDRMRFEQTQAQAFDHVVVNDDFNQALTRLEELVRAFLVQFNEQPSS